MDRKEFIRTCGFACVGIAGFGLLLESCNTSKMITGNISGSDLLFPVSDFEFMKDHERKFKKYLVVHNEKMQFPVCVFRFDENNYSALLMRCTHQGAELQVFGDKLQCPAHGSEFDNKGNVQNSPADKNLRTFPVTIENNNVKISLK